MSFKTAEVTLSAAVATGGAITVPYPAGTNRGTFTGGFAHKMWAAGLQAMLSSPTGFTASFGAASVTVTYLGATTLPEGSRVNFQFDTLGRNPDDVITDVSNVHNVVPLSDTPFLINLGAPVTADPDGILDGVVADDAPLSYDSGDFVGTFNGTIDVPRNLTATGSAGSDHVVTVTGTDEYGEVLVESLTLSGTSVIQGKKAFKTVTGVAVATGAADDTLDLGFGDVLGLPVNLPGTGLVIAEMESGAKATAGTLVAAVSSAATATTGDVRGTYDPNSACDGTKSFQLVALLGNPTDVGVAQFAG